MNIQGIWQLKKMAMRNLMRHKTKTIFTAMAITVSVAAFIFLNCWLGGTQLDSRRNIVQYEVGAAKLQTQLYFDRLSVNKEMPSYENFTDWEIYQKALADEGYNSAPRYVFAGTLFSGTNSIPVLFHGVDPASEEQTFRYPEYSRTREDGAGGFGRFVQNGNFEIALGYLAAERLKVGIPSRPLRLELEDFVLQVASNTQEAELIRSLYEQAQKRGYWDLVEETTEEGNERMVLRKDASKADLDRVWDMVIASGRNDLRINATIDMRAVPETIRKDRFEVELMESLRVQDKQLVQDAYEYFNLMEAYLLKEEVEADERQMNLVLDAMIRAGFQGAIRNVFQVFDVIVVGVINSPSPFPNSNVAFMPLDVLQDEAGMMLAGAVTELAINDSRRTLDKLPGERESKETLTAVLEKNLGYSLSDKGLAVHTWRDYMADYLGYESLQKGSPNFMVFLLFMLSFLGISNTILMSIMERTKETGMMRALGMTEGQMKLVYMLEAGFIGLIGALLGIILGCLINIPMVQTGIDFSAMADTMSSDGSIGYRVTGEFRSMWDWGIIIGSGIVATVLSFFIGYFPTKKALKLSIVDSLRFE